MHNKTPHLPEHYDDNNQEIRSKRSKLNLQILGLTAIHLLLLASWVGLSRVSRLSPRILLGLLILTALTWLWLIVTASRRFVLWNDHERRHEENNHLPGQH